METKTVYDEIVAHVESMKAEAEKFYSKGNASAGTRLRKGAQDLKNLCQNLRNEVTALKAK